MSSSKSLTIVITGASRGLGAGMAQTLLDKGHKLGLCSRSSPPPNDAFTTTTTTTTTNMNSNNNLYYQSNVNVCQPDDIQDFTKNVLEQLGTKHIDLWINNAGILGTIQPIRNTNIQDFEQNIQTNLMGVFHGTQTYIQHVRSSFQQQEQEEEEGNTTSSTTSTTTTPTATLVNISSGAAVKGYAGWSAYCASKAGVDRLTECALLEEQQQNYDNNNNSTTTTTTTPYYYFRAYSIAPGVIDTDMQVQIRNTPAKDFPMLDKFLNIKEEDAFNTPSYVAEQIEALALLEGAQTLPVVQRLPSEKE